MWSELNWPSGSALVSAVGSSVDSESGADSGVDADSDSGWIVGGSSVWISSGGLESSVVDSTKVSSLGEVSDVGGVVDS